MMGHRGLLLLLLLPGVDDPTIMVGLIQEVFHWILVLSLARFPRSLASIGQAAGLHGLRMCRRPFRELLILRV